MTQEELLVLIEQAAAEGWAELDLSGQELTELPPEIGKLAQLETLRLGKWENDKRVLEVVGDRVLPATTGNQLTDLPAEFAKLRNLRTLDLSGNPWGRLPACLAQLSQLKKLIVIRADLTAFPDVSASLAKLQQLYLSYNQIGEIPEALAQLQNLQQLYLNSNQIGEIPEALAQLQNLQQLYLSYNQIGEIPEALAQLQNLQQLDLRYNQIGEIPEALTQLQNLQQLDLSSNQIGEIPEALAQLQNLQQLDLRSNQIGEIPESLETLPNLTKLDLRQNFLPISPEILGPPEPYRNPGPVKDIFNYLHQLRSGEFRPLNEAKLLLVGQGSVGKTSLVKRLIENRFNENEPQTDGLSVREWSVHVNNKNVKLNVWDFGGQEIYHATHQFFLTKRSLYLLVCNCRTSEEENRLEYWLKLIQSFGGDSPVIIVGNKSDEQPLDINRKALRDKYPNIRAILETSCRIGDGIDGIREEIAEAVGQLHDVYNLLPLSWFEVKERLESLERDFIPYNEYIGICYEHQIPENRNQEQLIGLLHNLGLVLNFCDHPILQSTNVLNPDWVTQGIYALLSDETLKTKAKGILSYEDLNRILDPGRYPSDRHRYLVELMKEEKFQLCFALPDCPAPRFLIPGLLPKEEPKEIGLEGDLLEFQYHYRILPESVLSRFIVLSHEKIHNQTYWRSGVMLDYDEGEDLYNIARIKCDPEEKKIFIAISGRETTRRIFLAMIRDTFAKIHRSFADLGVREWVPVPGHPDHPPLEYKNLLGLEAMGEQEYAIGTLQLRVNVRQLLNGYEPLELRQRRILEEQNLGGHYGRAYEDMLDITRRLADRPIVNKAEATAMSENSKFVNNNQGANIGNFVNEAKDYAQVTASNFSQTSGANAAELLQIVATLRQLSTQFPPATQEEIIIDIDDVEAEIQKPEEQRNRARLKKCLKALLAVASAAAVSMAGANEFAGNANEFADKVIDLGNKVGIELQLPAAPESTP